MIHDIRRCKHCDRRYCAQCSDAEYSEDFCSERCEEADAED